MIKNCRVCTNMNHLSLLFFTRNIKNLLGGGEVGGPQGAPDDGDHVDILGRLCKMTCIKH